MARVLLTGSSGFIGKAVARRLTKAGHDLLGIDPIHDGSAAFEQAADDLSDPGRLRKIVAGFRPTHVIHMGGISGPMVIADQPARVMAINVVGSLNLLQACLDESVGVYVYCSSIATMGDFDEPEPIGELYPMRPDSPYGYSKAAMDMVLRGLWGRIPLDLCSLRFTAVYGPGRQTTQVIHDLIGAARSGQAVKVQGVTASSYVFVDDAADAAVAACFSGKRTQLAYFIAHPERVSLGDIASAIEAGAGPIPYEIDPELPPVQRGPVDLASASRDFGFDARIGYREGIRRMLTAG